MSSWTDAEQRELQVLPFFFFFYVRERERERERRRESCIQRGVNTAAIVVA